MSVSTTSAPSATSRMPDLPLVIWMVAAALGLGLAQGLSAGELVVAFNEGFGRSLGEFALILLPSFALAAALSHHNVASAAAGRTASLLSPLAGAGMICPDTAYAALSPAAGRYKLSTAFGAYAGFKLLYPAGPLIVATGLGLVAAGEVSALMMLGVGAVLTIGVWVASLVWIMAVSPSRPIAAGEDTSAGMSQDTVKLFLPFVAMAVLLIGGGLLAPVGYGAIDFLFLPKGALLCAALVGLWQVPPEVRRACLDSAVRRTAGLLLVIGAASALGGILTGGLAIETLALPSSDMLVLLGLFVVSMLFKLAQGSSMATFASVAPVAAPLVAASEVDPIAAVFAICLGSFVAILPNDSYYWLVRSDVWSDRDSDGPAIKVLTGGALVQAGVGMALLLLGTLIFA